MKEGRGNPSVCCGGQLPLHSSHRLSSSSCAGVAVGLFSEKSTPYSFLQNARPSAALRPAKGGAEGRGTPQSAAADSSPYTGEPKEGEPLSPLRRTAPLTQGSRGRGTPQSAAADSSPYILRTEIAFQAIPVLRMAYFTKRPYYGLFVKTHMLQPQVACEGGSRRRGQPVSLGAVRMRMKKGGG